MYLFSVSAQACARQRAAVYKTSGFHPKNNLPSLSSGPSKKVRISLSLSLSLSLARSLARSVSLSLSLSLSLALARSRSLSISLSAPGRLLFPTYSFPTFPLQPYGMAYMLEIQYDVYVRRDRRES